MARRQKTERERAEEALAVAQRRVERLVGAEKHQAELLALTRRELDEARRLLQYRQQHPALPRDSSTASASSITTSKETTTP